jgi:hypothetical protein
VRGAALGDGADPLPDLLGDVASGEAGREHAGGGDGAGGRSAVGDHDGAAQAEQRRAPVRLGIEPGAELAQPATLQQRAHPGGAGASEGGPQLRRGKAQRPFEGLERHVAGETVGDDHIDGACHQVAALHVALEVQWQRAAERFRRQQFVGAAGQRVSLARLGADREQTDSGHGGAERDLRVGHAQLAELDEHLRLRVGRRARVDEHRRGRMRGQYDGQAGPRDTGQREQPVPGTCHDRARRSGRHDRRGLTAPDQLAGDGEARPGPPEAGQGALVHPDDVLGGHHPQLRTGAEPGDDWPQPRRRPGQQHGEPVLALGGQGARHDLIRRVVAAHRVHRDHRLGQRPGDQLRSRSQFADIVAARRHMAHVVVPPGLSFDPLGLCCGQA